MAHAALAGLFGAQNKPGAGATQEEKVVTLVSKAAAAALRASFHQPADEDGAGARVSAESAGRPGADVVK